MPNGDEYLVNGRPATEAERAAIDEGRPLPEPHGTCEYCGQLTSTPGHYNDAHDGALLCDVAIDD